MSVEEKPDFNELIQNLIASAIVFKLESHQIDLIDNNYRLIITLQKEEE